MVDDEHKSEYFVQLFRLEAVLLALEERDEDVELPIVVQSALLLIDLVNLQDRRWLERPQPVLHER